MILLSYLLLNIIAIVFGTKEAILFERQGVETFKWNIHTLFVIERCFIVALLISGIFINIYDTLFLSLAYLFSFSFFHNGGYGYTKLSIRKLKPTLIQGIKYESPDDSSKNKKDFNSRFWMFLLSIAIIIVGFIVKF